MTAGFSTSALGSSKVPAMPEFIATVTESTLKVSYQVITLR
jgi:hypothetical protein